MPLPIGTWKMNINGKELDFVIKSANDSTFSSVFLGKMQDGFWDEVSQTITCGLTKEIPFTPVALFKGYLFRSPENPGPGRDVVATLAGSVQISFGSFAVVSLIGSPQRNVFGWFAQITEAH